MEWIVAMQQAITYMEEHIMEEINYEDVAKQVHTSSYEFHRAFSFLTGMTANAYIRNRRLSLAGREIVETNAKITDIALKYGYETPEGFTKAFTRFHGIAPKFVREESAKLLLFNPLVIKIIVEGGKSMDYRIVQTKEQKFIALVRSFRNEIINDEENHDIPDFWGECHDKNLVEAIRNLRPGTYVVFDCIGEDGDCIGDTWAKFYKEFLPQMGYESEAETDYEIYFEKGRSGLFCELWIPIRRK